MTSDGRQVLLEGYPHVATIPGLVILVVALAFNLLGDGVRDALDPHKQTA
jgi:peptide/nickel transport system permease protein